jgi:hypothetical protein
MVPYNPLQGCNGGGGNNGRRATITMNVAGGGGCDMKVLKYHVLAGTR